MQERYMNPLPPPPAILEDFLALLLLWHLSLRCSELSLTLV